MPPGSPELVRIAVAIETAVIDPICRHIDLSAASVEECSGANWSPALRLAGLIAPLPAPTRKADPDNHAYGGMPATGLTARSKVPMAIVVPPTNMGSRWPVRRSANADTIDNMMAATP